MEKIFLLFVLAVSCLTKLSEACTCKILHPQNSVCDADFVIKGKPMYVFHISKDESTPGPPPGPILADPEALFNFDDYKSRIYIMKVLRVFKGSMQKGDHIVVTIPGASAQCGFRFMEFNEPSKKWLISGYGGNGAYGTNSCTWNTKWSNVAPNVRKYLKTGKYVDNCDCLVAECDDVECIPDPVPEMSCTRNDPEDDDCYVRNLYCKKSHYKCRWVGPGVIPCTQNPIFI